MKRTLFVIGTLIIIVIVAVGIFAWHDTDPETDPIPAFLDISLSDADGRDVRLRDDLGTPLVINSWAMWCPFCRAELEDFADLQNEFGDRIIVIAVNRAEVPSEMHAFTDSIGVSDRLVFLLDPEDRLYRALGGFTMPETVFVDESGTVILHKRGFMALDEMRAHTRTLLGEE